MQELVTIENNDIVIASEVIEEYKTLKKAKEDFELKEKEFKQVLKDKMSELGIEKWSGCGLNISIKYSKGKKTIDTKRLEKELPDVYEEYLKQGNPYSSLTIEVIE